MSEILIIDDDLQMNEALTSVIEQMDHTVKNAFSLKDGLRKVQSGKFDVVFLDVRMPDGNGLDFLPVIKEAVTSPEVIIITALADPNGAELAIKNGAWDYIKKPALLADMTLPLKRALQFREEKAKRRPVLLKREGIVGKSSQMQKILESIGLAAGTTSNVLIVGETGTGKELVAQAIHENSSRSHRNFVVVDCTALPESLIESILFGHEKGAFTGAEIAKNGLFEQADNGTLFLDEVGELPLSIQKTFLRIIQERQFRPIGAQMERKSDFRLIAATNRNLEQMVENGQFRRDFFFRLRSLTIEVPPLRERPEDIKELVIYYLTRLCDQQGSEIKGLSSDFIKIMLQYDWPGNIRELINALEQALLAANYESTLFPYYLPTQIRIKVAKDSYKETTISHDALTVGDSLKDMNPYTLPKYNEYRNSMENMYMQKLMAAAKNNKTKACALSGLSRTRLYQLLKKGNLMQ